ncbi:glycosyltransferase [Brevundimonas sp. VNH65]|uniref:glycosyltransferase n=1 Tax=Brevundimonas sp. VNH65 TaxID=3400917 RepID=UPI003C08B7E8
MSEGLLQRWRRARRARAEAVRAAERLRLGVPEGDVARRQFRWDEAAAVYSAYLAERPGDAAVVVRLARTLAAAGRRDEALAALRTAKRGRSDSGALARALTEMEAAPPSPPDWETVRNHPRPLPTDEGVAASVVVLTSGVDVVLRPEAMAWLTHALAVTSAEVAYSDHELRPDRSTAVWTPVLQAAPHPLDLELVPHPPVVALFRADAAPAGEVNLRIALAQAAARGRAAHVPLVLAEVARPAAAPPVEPALVAEQQSILVIMPTRDRGDVLETMVDSLFDKAADPGRLRILVIDNGSRDPATLDLLDRWTETPRIDVLRVDAPFNWSDLNNRGAEGRDADILLFANNDMEMRTSGWDARLAAHLARSTVGAVGARLVYPSGNPQHAGMILGARPSADISPGPLHEGLGAAATDAGPLDRWVRARPAAAVTGAFLAVRRSVFVHAGGFDARTFQVGGNDSDFCLRVRALGLSVLYAGDIELSHEESLSRGHDDDPDRQARAEAERRNLIRIWGDDALIDPSLNPGWAPDGVRLFAGHRMPSAEQADAWIRRSLDAWRTRRRA